MANNLGITNPTIGGSYDTWGSTLDSNIAAINKAFGDILTLTDTSGTVTLTQSQSNYAAFKFTGSGSTLVTVSAIDDIGRLWFVNNARASGSVKFQCADGLGTSVTLAAADRRFIYSDGTDCIDATLATIAIASVTGLQAALDAKQTLDASLTAYAALTTAANKGIYYSGADTPVTFDLTSFGRTLGGYASEATFKAGVNLEANTDFYAPAGTDVALADGGTGASTAADARTNLGVGTGDSPQFTGIEVGATDTTVTRAEAGVIAVEGVPLYSNISQNSKSAAYTLVLGDAQKHIFHPAADTTARVWTIPANSSVAFPIGTAITFINEGSAGTITITITTDTLVLAGAGTTGSRQLAANGMATAIKKTSTSWIISGTGVT